MVSDDVMLLCLARFLGISIDYYDRASTVCSIDLVTYILSFGGWGRMLTTIRSEPPFTNRPPFASRASRVRWMSLWGRPCHYQLRPALLLPQVLYGHLSVHIPGSNCQRD